MLVLFTQVECPTSPQVSVAALRAIAAARLSVLCDADIGSAQTTASHFPVGLEHLDNTIEMDHLSLSSVRVWEEQ